MIGIKSTGNLELFNFSTVKLPENSFDKGKAIY